MKLDHMLIMASDLAESARHYDRLLPLLGFTRTREWVWQHPGTGLALDLRAAEEGPGYRRRGPGLNHMGFAAGSEGELDAIAEAARSAGLVFGERQQFGEAAAYFIPDPDGLRLEIIWEPSAQAG